jgi:glycosyltransferase involved in cell wall biosynthesis
VRPADSLLSVVVPAYQEGAHLAESLRRITSVLGDTGHPHEIIVVDDGSTDNTWEVIREVCAAEPMVVGIRLSRNFGKESALAAGLVYCRGRAAIVMDADLQHPPELIPEMVRIWREEGAEIVEAQKSRSRTESPLVSARRRVFNGMVRRMSGFDLSEASDFKLLDEKVLEAWRRLGERSTFFRGMVAWLGFRVVRIPFDVASRTSGDSKWSLRGLVNLALVGLTAFSAVPLRLASILGVLFLVFAVGASIYTLIYRLLGIAQPGFTTVILLQMFTSSLVLLCLGIIGEYIARIYDEVKARPRYVVSDFVGLRERSLP